MGMFLRKILSHFHPRRPVGMVTVGIVALMSTGGLVELGPFWQDFSALGNTRAAQSSEFFDGNDWEIQAWDFRAHFTTDNNTDDLNISSAGPVAVWQRLTEQGWEIIFWSVLEQTEFQVTQNEVDDVDPKTDGRYLVWRSLVDDVWTLMVMDLENPDEPAKQLSGGGAVDAVVIGNGMVVWQEWIDFSWEIVAARPNGETRRITDNMTADLNPQMLEDEVYFEGEDSEAGDREIYRFNVWQGDPVAVTQNDLDDDALQVYGGRIQWYERREGISARMELDETGRADTVEFVVSASAPILEEVSEDETVTDETVTDETVVDETVVDETEEEPDSPDSPDETIWP